MPSNTQKVKKIRANKRVAQGQRRKRELRRDDRVKAAQLAEVLGLSKVGLLASDEAPKV